jgi:xylan 1,4-beta-xylosidase
VKKEMNVIKKIKVDPGTTIPFNNKVDYCVGTGRMGLALHKAYFDQLKLVQEAIGFSHIRGHGLFCDDMAVCQRYDDKSGQQVFEYNYTYVDMVMDNYLNLGLRPFLELGFMPQQMASGDQTIFYWKGNVTPPINYEDWTTMVKTLLYHLIERYGKKEIVQWPIEVWNEPNLDSFWKDANMQEYLRLYEYTTIAVKEVDTAFKVGGPSICGINDELWLRSFLEYIQVHKLPLDFVTRHHYTIHIPKSEGRYRYALLHDLDESIQLLETSREIIDSFDEFRGMDIHITEFNTAYGSDCPIHDTNLNAAYIAALLSRLGDKHASYSYWTFGDIFEENGVPFTPFHGGFGMVANGCIPKPTFWVFVFYKQLQGTCVHRSKEAVIVQMPDGAYRGILWNVDVDYTGKSIEIELNLPAEKGEYCYITRTVDEECCNPLKLWHDMGEPSHLLPEQVALLKEHAVPMVKSGLVQAEVSKIKTMFVLKPNAVIYFELNRVERKSDRGYSWERIVNGK